MKKRKRLSNYIWILPAILFLIIVIVIPFTRIINLSFYSYSLSKPTTLGKFIALKNYVKLFHDTVFLNSIKTLLLIVIPAVAIQLFVGFLIALFLERNFVNHRIILTIFILPTMLAPIVVGLIWRFLLYIQNGLITYILNQFGFLTETSILSFPVIAVIAIILIDSWEWTPFVGAIFLAGLMALPEEPFEAAITDGASNFDLVKHITVPLLKPVIIVAATLRLVDALKIFDIIYVLTNGGPAGATDVVNLYMYRLNFIYFDLGYGAVPTVALMVIMILVATSIFLKQYIGVRKKESSLGQ